MKTVDPLQTFEQLTIRLKDDAPPRVHIAPRVLRRIRAIEASSSRVLEFLAAGSCAAAVVVAAVGLSLLPELTDPLEALFQIVPPIGLQ